MYFLIQSEFVWLKANRDKHLYLRLSKHGINIIVIKQDSRGVYGAAGVEGAAVRGGRGEVVAARRAAGAERQGVGAARQVAVADTLQGDAYHAAHGGFLWKEQQYYNTSHFGFGYCFQSMWWY